MLLEIGQERAEPLIERAPRAARIGRQDEPARHVPNGRQFAYMVVVVGPHDCDRVLDARHSAPAHGRKQHLFFLAHMDVQFTEQLPQSGGQSARDHRVRRVNGLDSLRLFDQPGQLLPVPGVKALFDMIRKDHRIDEGGFSHDQPFFFRSSGPQQTGRRANASTFPSESDAAPLHRMDTPDNTHCKYQFISFEASDVRLTSFTDFGLRMLMRMAAAPERVFSTAELANEFGLPRNHLAKIIQRLAHAGIVETRRGGGGGAQIARPPQAITLGEIVRQLEVGQAIVECFAETPGLCSLEEKCQLRSRLRAAELAFLAELDRYVLADIALENAPISGLPLPQPKAATPRSSRA